MYLFLESLLSLSVQKIAQSYEWIFVKFGVGVGCDPRRY